MNLSYIDRIWRTKGSLPLDNFQSAPEVFDKLVPLFQSDGTVYSIDGDTLTYKNKNPAAQNRIATFNSGTLRVAPGEGGSKLFYNLTSPALLFCFLAPLLFLAFGQFVVALGEFEIPTPAEQKIADAKEKAEKAKPLPQLNPIDKFLGAPAPEKPKDDPKKDKEKDKEKGKNQRSPTSSYVFAGIFAALYLVGRFLEPWLIRRTFHRELAGPAPAAHEAALAK